MREWQGSCISVEETPRIGKGGQTRKNLHRLTIIINHFTHAPGRPAAAAVVR
jgi:hypothetical protein